ncbi:MAG: hypothetical protein AAF739_03855 [Pseudomonadota bacterium]
MIGLIGVGTHRGSGLCIVAMSGKSIAPAGASRLSFASFIPPNRLAPALLFPTQQIRTNRPRSARVKAANAKDCKLHHADDGSALAAFAGRREPQTTSDDAAGFAYACKLIRTRLILKAD